MAQLTKTVRALVRHTTVVTVARGASIVQSSSRSNAILHNDSGTLVVCTRATGAGIDTLPGQVQRHSVRFLVGGG